MPLSSPIARPAATSDPPYIRMSPPLLDSVALSNAMPLPPACTPAELALNAMSSVPPLLAIENALP